MTAEPTYRPHVTVCSWEHPTDAVSPEMIEAGVKCYRNPPSGSLRSHDELCRQIYLAMNAARTTPIDDEGLERQKALQNARAWIFECWGWLMETDLDMTCPMETDPLDIVEQIDALIGIDAALAPKERSE